MISIVDGLLTFLPAVHKGCLPHILPCVWFVFLHGSHSDWDDVGPQCILICVSLIAKASVFCFLHIFVLRTLFISFVHLIWLLDFWYFFFVPNKHLSDV